MSSCSPRSILGAHPGVVGEVGTAWDVLDGAGDGNRNSSGWGECEDPRGRAGVHWAELGCRALTGGGAAVRGGSVGAPLAFGFGSSSEPGLPGDPRAARLGSARFAPARPAWPPLAGPPPCPARLSRRRLQFRFPVRRLRGAERRGMELRGYQREAAAPALRGRNSIVWLPTGAGKTRVAVHVCRRHLESRRGAKVHLVDQHTEKEFHALQDTFKVTSISGDTSHKTFFADLVKKSDVVICTAQILQNALVSTEEDMHVELTDFSLLVIDECHHTHKDAVYNKIMLRYLQRKLGGQQDLPQVLGLTASPGTGGATSFEGAVEHILQICANLDTEKITSVQDELQHLQSHVPQPKKQYDLCQERVQDPFGDQLKKVMVQIQQFMEKPDFPRDFGTQIYEQRIVELEKTAAEMFCRKTRVCALHLRKYNDALLINDTVRMLDAFQCLQQFYSTERDKKDPTEQFLTATFEENRASLQALAGDHRYENPRLAKLERILREHFQPLGTSRGIVFTKTRQSAHSLLSWLQTTATLRGQHIRAAVLTGAGYSNQTRHMTQNEQQDVIKQFRQGALNLLFSTSVAEEGLDIPECNIVVRYGLMTNEIAMMQARGRARAENSVYSVLAKANTREVTRELLNEDLVELMKSAIQAVQAMPEQEYFQKVGTGCCCGHWQGQAALAVSQGNTRSWDGAM
ncbi:probable ATP-dependent RNA helicase DHX58 isoform X1 [Passer montanus]|uniref:probable ATP-dependent RNA helicase DHX58 isoform X1 n=1 Tax=Passer montanus TaxID=9160 RepID=UPI00196055C1|nr:probable ATP-dependent RNA helicase DHX58 isoform X1 [Passer montanus]